jgi:hypothetical protein
MPTPPTPSDRLADLVRLYNDDPLEDGDAVLLLDDTVCLEVERLAAEWDPVLRSSMADVLRQTARQVRVLIARPCAELRGSDYQLWRELHADLRSSEVSLLPLGALPAA